MARVDGTKVPELFRTQKGIVTYQVDASTLAVAFAAQAVAKVSIMSSTSVPRG